MQPALERVERLREIVDRASRARRVGKQRPRIPERIAYRAMAITETLEIEPDTVPRQQRLERRLARKQALPCLEVRHVAEMPAVRVAEDVREEHVSVFTIWFK